MGGGVSESWSWHFMAPCIVSSEDGLDGLAIFCTPRYNYCADLVSYLGVISGKGHTSDAGTRTPYSGVHLGCYN